MFLGGFYMEKTILKFSEFYLFSTSIFFPTFFFTLIFHHFSHPGTARVIPGSSLEHPQMIPRTSPDDLLRPL